MREPQAAQVGSPPSQSKKNQKKIPVFPYHPHINFVVSGCPRNFWDLHSDCCSEAKLLHIKFANLTFPLVKSPNKRHAALLWTLALAPTYIEQGGPATRRAPTQSLIHETWEHRGLAAIPRHHGTPRNCSYNILV